MFLRGAVAVHLKSVVAYCKNLGKCLIFFLKVSMTASKVQRTQRGCPQWRCEGHPITSVWACITLTPVARLMGLPANIECLSMGMHCSHSHSQTHRSPSKYWMPFHWSTRGKTEQNKGIFYLSCHNHTTVTLIRLSVVCSWSHSILWSQANL